MSEDENKSGPPDDTELHQADVRHLEASYDRSDLSANAVLAFLVGLAATVALILIISWGVFRFFGSFRLTAPPRNVAIVPAPTKLGKKGEPTLTFPAPQLQPNPVADLNKFRAAVEEQLNTYGWVDQKAGIVHIPIERAIDIVSQNGLPTRPKPVLPPRAGFASGDGTPAGIGGGTAPKGNN